jgi:hypothetical protein
MRSTVRSRMLAAALSGCAVVALSGLTATPALADEPMQTAAVEPAPAEPGGPTASTDPAQATVPGASAGPGGAVAGTEPSQCATTAADTLGWGQPTDQSDFDGTALPPDWHPYGPEPGHDKKGRRTPDQITVADGVVTVAGDEQGDTGAMSWHPGQRYGRWEACVRSDPGAGGYHPVILLWPVKEDWPVGGEIDWMEISADDRQDTDFFLHYGEQNDQEYGTVKHDATEWTAYALEWTPEKMTAYLNGKEWYSTTDTSHFPPGAMNMTVQLDLFPPAGGETSMQLDWTRQWALPESVPAELSLAPGAPATGQGDLHPDRTPKPIDELPPLPEPGATAGQTSTTQTSTTTQTATATQTANGATGTSSQSQTSGNRSVQQGP